MAQQQQNEFQYYLRTVKRRKWAFVMPMLLVMLLCTAVALIMPSTYRSEALVLIEAPEISNELVQAQFSGLVEERLRSLNQRVLSRSTLLEMVDEYDLYGYLLTETSPTELAEIMRADIDVEMVTTEVHDAETVRTGLATYAFRLSYEGREPGKVLKVANRLLSMYLEEDSRQRAQQSEHAISYLNQRMAEVEAELAAVEDEFSAFKRENRYTLPEMLSVNLESQERLDSRIVHMGDKLYQVENRVAHWTGELASTPKFIKVQTTGGVRQMTPEEQLDRMRREYVEITASKAVDHPDVVDLEKRIRALETQVRKRQDLGEYSDELERKENELAELRKLYSDKHPDVRRLEDEVARLQEDIRTLSERYKIEPKQKEMELNPQWVHAKNQVQAYQVDLNRFMQERRGLEEQVQLIKERIEKTSETELGYNVLKTKLDALKLERDQLTQQMMNAKSAKGLESSGLGERFVVVDSPTLPEAPSKPNRPLLLILGLFVSGIVGATSCALAEVLDQTVHSGEDLARLTGTRTLAAIPMIEDEVKGRFGALGLMAVAASVTGLILALIVFHYLIIPLDALFGKIFLILGLY